MDGSTKTQARFRNLIARLLSWYPNTWVGNEVERKRRVTEHYRQLRQFDLGTIEEAFDRMPELYPDRLPTAGQLRRACQAILSDRLAKQRTEQQLERDADDDQEHREYLASIPEDCLAQEDWIAEGESPSDRLGRRWAVDSKRRGRHPSAALPTAEVRRRMAKLFAAMDGIEG